MYIKLILLFAGVVFTLSTTAQKDTATLKKAVVTAVKPYLVQKADRIVINVDAMLTAAGTNTLELLEQLPGVAVDLNGALRFNGRAGVLVLIDDKPTYLSVTDLANYLRGMPSALLDRIELISNPPARYDAAAGAGVIVIHTKKLHEKGFNWQTATGYGQSVYGRTNEGASANWRRGKVNVFSTVSYSWQHSYRRLELERSYVAPATFFDETSYNNPIRETVTAKAGMDYQWSPRTTLGFVVSGIYSTTNTHNPEETVISDARHQPDSVTQANNSSRDHFANQSANLNLTHHFRRTGELLTADADMVQRNAQSRQLFLNTTVDPAGVPLSTDDQQAHLPSSIRIYSGKIDYTLPLHHWQIEAGAKASSVATDNRADYYYLLKDSTVPDNDKTNHFLYTENIQAAYTSVTLEAGRLSFQGGLRLERTEARGHQLGNAVKPDSGFTRHYTDGFPTVNLDYKLDTSGHHHLHFAYGRRINRPSYQSLNPFIFLVNQYMYIAGNPYLRPQYSDNLELSWRWAQLLTTTLSYNYTRDIEQELIQPSGDLFISQPGNIGHHTGLGFSANLSWQPLKRWNLNLFSQLINSRYAGAIGDSSLSTNTISFSFNWNNQFALTPDWAADLGGNYSGPATEAQFHSKATGMIAAGISRKLLHRRATLRLVGRDLFHTVRPAGTLTNIPGVIVRYRNYVDTQVVGLSFSYAFNSGKTNKTRKTGSAEDEQGRIKD